MKIRKLIASMATAVAVMTGGQAQADVVQLGFILDSSGSIGSANWTTIVNGLKNAVNTWIPTDSTYEVSVVRFSTAASLDIDSFLVTDAASRTALSNQIGALSFLGGSTDFAAAFTTMQSALFGGNESPTLASYVNFATDGVPNSAADGITARDALIAAGVDNISIEGIGGGVNTAYLKDSICYPQACDDTSPYNFPTQGFYIGVVDADAYVTAIGNKLQVVTNQVPEPNALALAGLALLGLGVARRQKHLG